MGAGPSTTMRRPFLAQDETTGSTEPALVHRRSAIPAPPAPLPAVARGARSTSAVIAGRPRYAHGHEVRAAAAHVASHHAGDAMLLSRLRRDFARGRCGTRTA